MPSPTSRLAARAAARLPARIERELQRLRSLATAAPTIGLPRARRVLVLAPHPDDETLVCGGTAALLAAAGADVRVVVATDGDAATVDLPRAEVGRRRRAEVAAACDALGLPAPVRLGLRDGDLAGQRDVLAGELAAHLADHRPELVLLPWFGDGHRDHRALNVALADAAGRHTAAGARVWGGEAWTPAPISRLVDVSDAAGRLRAAAAAHVTAAHAFDLDAMLALKRYRSVHGLRGRGLAEGFLAADLATYAAWVRDDGGAT
jgi:LmbE family N-acetylglucosaminyl deacetylase